MLVHIEILQFTCRQNSKQFQTVQSPTPHSVNPFWIFSKQYLKYFETLCRVKLICNSALCQSSRSLTPPSVSQHAMEPDSVQCQSAWSRTPRSVSLHGVTYFANISAKKNLSAHPFQPVYQGPSWVGFMERISQKSCDTATLRWLDFKTNARWSVRLCTMHNAHTKRILL